MNLYEKIQKVKLELSQRELKKTGENKFSGFKYYELGDFLPSIIELCEKYGLFTQITFTETEGILAIVDTTPQSVKKNDIDEPMFNSVSYKSPVKDLELKGANAIQALGGVQTYLRRYLYMNAFDIVEADLFDSADFEKKKKAKAQKSSIELTIESCKKAFMALEKKEDKDKIGQTMKKLGYNSFKELGEAANANDIIELAQQLNVEIPEDLQETK